MLVVTNPNEMIARINRKRSFRGSARRINTPVVVTKILCPSERETRETLICWNVGDVNSRKIRVRKPPS